MENTNTSVSNKLFHARALAGALEQEQIPSAHQQILQDWAKNIATLNFQDRTAHHAAFLKNILVDILGYKPESAQPYTLKDMSDKEDSYFDAALGQFDKEDSNIMALLKVMGPSSLNLDSAADDKSTPIALAKKQAKEISGCKFFLLTNLDEIRIYSLVHRRTIYERFSLIKMVEDAAEFRRFYLLLKAENMVSGQTFQWLNESIVAGLQDKLTKNHPTVKDIYGSIRTGLSMNTGDPFVVDIKAYKQIMQEDSKSGEVLKPFFPGDKLRRWHADIDLHFLIYTPKGQVDIEAYPAIKRHLEQFKDQLEKRSGDMKWYELDITEENKSQENEVRLGFAPKQRDPGFVIGQHGAQYGTGSYYIPNADFFLFGLLNSTPLQKMIKVKANLTDEGLYEILPQHIESLPVPDAEGLDRAKMGRFANFCLEKTLERRDAIRYFQGSTAYNLSPQKLESKLSDTLENWFAHDFDTFRKEIIACFGVDIPEDSLQLWSDYFHQERNSIISRDAELKYTTNEIDMIVYDMFGLDEDEIFLLNS